MLEELHQGHNAVEKTKTFEMQKVKPELITFQ